MTLLGKPLFGLAATFAISSHFALRRRGQERTSEPNIPRHPTAVTTAAFGPARRTNARKGDHHADLA